MKISSALFCLFDIDASYSRKITNEELEIEPSKVSVSSAFSSVGRYLWQGIEEFEKRRNIYSSCRKKLNR